MGFEARDYVDDEAVEGSPEEDLAEEIATQDFYEKLETAEREAIDFDSETEKDLAMCRRVGCVRKRMGGDPMFCWRCRQAHKDRMQTQLNKERRRMLKQAQNQQFYDQIVVQRLLNARQAQQFELQRITNQKCIQEAMIHEFGLLGITYVQPNFYLQAPPQQQVNIRPLISDVTADNANKRTQQQVPKQPVVEKKIVQATVPKQSEAKKPEQAPQKPATTVPKQSEAKKPEQALPQKPATTTTRTGQSTSLQSTIKQPAVKTTPSDPMDL